MEKLQRVKQHYMKPYLTLLLIVLTSINYNCLNSSNASVVEIITAEEMKQITQLENVQVVDVRTNNEYKNGYIQKAQNIDYLSPTFDLEIQQLDKSKPVVVYCEKGGRSSSCVDKMKKAGFVKIYELEGGIAKWKFKGFPLEKK